MIMLKNMRSKIKDLKKEDKAYLKKHDINTDGRLVIDIVLESASDAYSKFSPQHDKRLDPGLSEYIEAENVALQNPLHFKIYNNEYAADQASGEEFKALLMSDLKDKRYKAYKALRFNMLASIICLLVGLAVIALSVSLRFIFDYIEVVYVSIEIMAWVFVWEAVDLFFFGRPELKLKYIKAARLTEATVSFCEVE